MRINMPLSTLCQTVTAAVTTFDYLYYSLFWNGSVKEMIVIASGFVL